MYALHVYLGEQTKLTCTPARTVFKISVPDPPSHSQSILGTIRALPLKAFHVFVTINISNVLRCVCRTTAAPPENEREQEPVSDEEGHASPSSSSSRSRISGVRDRVRISQAIVEDSAAQSKRLSSSRGNTAAVNFSLLMLYEYGRQAFTSDSKN